MPSLFIVELGFYNHWCLVVGGGVCAHVCVVSEGGRQYFFKPLCKTFCSIVTQMHFLRDKSCLCL